jgi:lipopolysaccharide export system protein LptC
MNQRTVLIIFLVVTGAAASWGAWQLRPKIVVEDVTGPDRSDYTLDMYHLVVMDKFGAISFKGEGPYLSRNLNDQSLALSEPIFRFPDKKSAGDYISHSKTGWVSSDSDEVRLAHSVVVDGPIVPDEDQSHMYTEQLNVFPNSKTAHSDLLVTANRGQSIMHGIGMNANMNTSRIELLSKVSLHNVPTPKN